LASARTEGIRAPGLKVPATMRRRRAAAIEAARGAYSEESELDMIELY